MKNNVFSANFYRNIIIITITAIAIITLLSFFIIFAIKYYNKKQNFAKIHHKKIDELKDQINWIKFDKTYIEKNQYIVSFAIQTKTLESAKNIQKIIENCEISENKFSAQLQNDPQNTRANLLLLTFNNKEKYNPEFEKIIKKLMNSKYINQKYQKLSEIGGKLLRKSLNEETLTKKESELLLQFQTYQLPEDTSFAQLHKRIHSDNFAEFILTCQKNQKPLKNLDESIIDNAQPTKSI